MPASAPHALTPSEQHQLTRLKYLTEVHLPALARQHRWPIRFDHCFKRICFDHAFADVWYHHLPRPAERHIHGDALAIALACAEQIAAEGLPILQQRDAASLRFRGKKAKAQSASGSVP